MKTNDVLNDQNLKASILYISISLYVSSLLCNCIYEGKDGAEGWWLLAFGWMGMIFHGGATFIWLANPILFATWRNLHRRKTSLLLGSIALIISLSFLCFDTIEGTGDWENWDNEKTDGQDVAITGYGVGYYLWLLSSAVVCIGNIIRLKLQPVDEVSE